MESWSVVVYIYQNPDLQAKITPVLGQACGTASALGGVVVGGVNDDVKRSWARFWAGPRA